MEIKPQDILFVIALLALIYFNRPRLTTGAGVALLVLSVPLFAFWIFFTAERLVMYAAAFFLLAIIQYLFIIRNKE